MNLFKPNDEVRVWSRQHNGRTIWFAYNPKTEKQITFPDQLQLREWLDNYDPGESPHRVKANWGGGQNAHPLHLNMTRR